MIPPGLGARGGRLDHWNIAIVIRFTRVYHVSHVVTALTRTPFDALIRVSIACCGVILTGTGSGVGGGGSGGGGCGGG